MTKPIIWQQAGDNMDGSVMAADGWGTTGGWLRLNLFFFVIIMSNFLILINGNEVLHGTWTKKNKKTIWYTMCMCLWSLQVAYLCYLSWLGKEVSNNVSLSQNYITNSWNSLNWKDIQNSVKGCPRKNQSSAVQWHLVFFSKFIKF